MEKANSATRQASVSAIMARKNMGKANTVRTKRRLIIVGFFISFFAAECYTGSSAIPHWAIERLLLDFRMHGAGVNEN